MEGWNTFSKPCKDSQNSDIFVDIPTNFKHSIWNLTFLNNQTDAEAELERNTKCLFWDEVIKEQHFTFSNVIIQKWLA